MTKHKLIFGIILAALLSIVSFQTIADTPIKLFNSMASNSSVPLTKITTIVKNYFYVNHYRSIKVQVIYNKAGTPDHLLIYLFSKKYHGFKVVRVNITSDYQAILVIRNYTLSKQDYQQQPGIHANQAVCPDPSVQFIAFAPNSDPKIEQQITIEVANAAKAHHLKTVELLQSNATRNNYLNYMSCPKLEGNFYDGDADPYLITTVDGVISADDIRTVLANKFRYKVTNIWLACEAYNDPMKSAVIDTAETQKYAAGIDNLFVGPSDKTAACAMEAAMNGKPMAESFQSCYINLDNKLDIWGFGGQGSDYFGK